MTVNFGACGVQIGLMFLLGFACSWTNWAEKNFSGSRGYDEDHALKNSVIGLTRKI